MGVKDLWEVLDEIKESKKLDLLSSKKVAIDLSGWVVQAETRKGLNLSKNPYMKLLYFRVRHLLLHGIHPVFILEGKMPEIKEKEFRRRNHLESTSSGNTRSRLDNSLKQCQKLLTSLGLPCLKAAGEAEAYCAFLCLNKKVDAVMTEDSDAILYGADPVYRGFKIGNEDILEYSLKSDKNKLKLDRKKCVALALLLGCDYGEKVSKIGVATASKFLSEAKEIDILQRFHDWKTLNESQLFPGYDSKPEKMASHCRFCGHLGKKSTHDKEGCRVWASNVCFRNSDTPCSCAWHKNNEILTAHKSEIQIYRAVKNIKNFPNDKLIDEYLNYTDEIPDDDSLEWKCPSITDFKERTHEVISPTFDWLKEILPLISAWQFQKLEKIVPTTSCEFLLLPLRIKKKKIIKRVKYLVVEWSMKDGENCSIVETEEQESIFQKAYPKLVEDFYYIEEKSKQKKKTKPAVENRKVNDATISTPPLSNNVIKLKILQELSFENSKNINSFSVVNPNISTNQSSSSFSDLPLFERIRLLSIKNDDVVPDQNNSTKISSVKSDNKPKHETKLPSTSTDIISLVFDSSGFSELSDPGKPRPDTNTENIAPLTPFELNRNFCLVFSDSDDSFLSCHKEEQRFFNTPSILSRKSVLLSDDSNESFVINKNLCFEENHVEDMLSVEHNVYVSPGSSSSPRPIYSVSKTSKQNSPGLTIDNSPVNFSTPKSRHLKISPRKPLYPQVFNVFKQKTMNLVFSPVVFDSSDDSILN